METTTVTQTTTVTAPETQARQSLSSDLDTFLKLLTAQIENQDPLEPADGTEYAAQLAQFSNVEQAVRTNELLVEMSNNMARQDMALAAGWIGMDVRHSGALVMTGDPVRLYLDIPAAADRAEMIVRTPAGDEILRRPIDPSVQTMDWSGGDGLGGTLPDGAYVLEVAAAAGDADLGTTPVSHYARVEEVTIGQGSADLILTGGVRLSTAEIDALRQPG